MVSAFGSPQTEYLRTVNCFFTILNDHGHGLPEGNYRHAVLLAVLRGSTDIFRRNICIRFPSTFTICVSELIHLKFKLNYTLSPGITGDDLSSAGSETVYL